MDETGREHFDSLVAMGGNVSFGTRSGLGILVMGGALVWVACVGDDPPLVPESTSGKLCGEYCSRVMTNCTADRAQYRSENECLAACQHLPEGTKDDVHSNSVGCRLRKAEEGGDSCSAAGAFSTICGEPCDGFCSIVSGNCGVALSPYTDEGSCIETCHGFVFDPGAGTGPKPDPSGPDTLNCRCYHSILSLDPPGRAVHCGHTGVTSAVCKPSGTHADAGH